MTQAVTLPAMQPVDSTNIDAIGYSAAECAAFIRFKSGGLYRYADVPPETAAAFMDAPSKGRYFRAAFAGKFTHTKIGSA